MNMKKIIILLLASASLIAMDAPDLNKRLNNAVKEGNKRAVEQLLKEGADPNTNYTLAEAALFDHLEICELLIKYGANINQFDAKSSMGTPLLIEVIKNNNERMVKFLIEHGANLNNTNSVGSTPLIDAAYKRNANILFTILTTIPLEEREKLLKEQFTFNAIHFTKELPRDIRKQITHNFLNNLVEDQMRRVGGA